MFWPKQIRNLPHGNGASTNPTNPAQGVENHRPDPSPSSWSSDSQAPPCGNGVRSLAVLRVGGHRMIIGFFFFKGLEDNGQRGSRHQPCLQPERQGIECQGIESPTHPPVAIYQGSFSINSSWCSCLVSVQARMFPRSPWNSNTPPNRNNDLRQRTRGTMDTTAPPFRTAAAKNHTNKALQARSPH